MSFVIRPIQNLLDLDCARALFKRYQEEANEDLCFQGFAQELANLPQEYDAPSGQLLIAFHEIQAIGCVALRFYKDGECEMKRLYVIPAFRSRGVGEGLIRQIIVEAKRLGYERIVLSTMPSMMSAQKLYERIGFCDQASTECGCTTEKPTCTNDRSQTAGIRTMFFDLSSS